MKIDSSIQLHQGLAMSRQDVDAAIGILGIFILGVFLTWYPLAPRCGPITWLNWKPCLKAQRHFMATWIS